MAILCRGECVRVPDGRPGRIREKRNGSYRVRVRKKSGRGDEILTLAARELARIDPPAGWMTPEGYNRRVAAIRRSRRAD